MKLPNYNSALVPLDKLVGYSLDLDHPSGKHKARVFASVLGLTRDDAAWLRDRILDAVLTAEAIEKEPTEFGRRYVVDFSLATEVGAAVVRTAWIVRHDEAFPQLTSCYIP